MAAPTNDPEPWTPTCLDDPIEEELVKQKMERYINKLENSQFYHNFREQLQTPPISEHLSRILGLESNMKMVIYGIGKIELHENPRWQLSLVILMKKDFKWIGDIEVFDPFLSATECKILEALGCIVLSSNEHGRRKSLQPTMFFMPYCSFTLYNNLLEANWKLSLLSNIVLFGNRLKTLDIHQMKHISTAAKFTLEFLLWQFFNPIAETELQLINGRPLDGGRIERKNCNLSLNREIIERKNSNKVEILIQEVKRCLENFEVSEFYHSFRDKLQNMLISEFSPKVLGSGSKMQIAIYGIGELKGNFMLHLSLAILMKKDFKWIGSIEVFDYVPSATKCQVLETFGCSVLLLKEHEMRRVLKPTMFFMQNCALGLYNNLMKANWKPDLLSNIIVLCGNNFKECKDVIDSSMGYLHQPNKRTLRNFLSDSMGHILAAQTFTNEFRFKTIFQDHHQTSQDSSCWEDYYDAFYHSTWHFFGPVSETQLKSMNEVIQKGEIVL